MFYIFYCIRDEKKEEGRKEQRKGKRKAEFINQ